MRRDLTPEIHDWWKGLGRRMKTARKARGMTQKDFAKMLGVTAQNYSAFENGKASLDLYLFYKACMLLGKCANSMMGRRIKS